MTEGVVWMHERREEMGEDSPWEREGVVCMHERREETG